MAVPALIGLAALGGLVSKVIEKLIDFALTKVAKKLAVLSLIFAGLFIAVQALFALVSAYAEPLLSSLPAEVTSLLGMALPSNTLTCIAAIVSVEASCIAYALTLKTLEYQSRVA